MAVTPAWLETGALFPSFISCLPEKDTGIIIIVPAFDEPNITDLLDSLSLCTPPQCKCEVLVIINAPEDASSENLKNNMKSLEDINTWKSRNGDIFFNLFVVNLGQPSLKGWGVGLARKAGMDEAARRFISVNNQDGVIASMDGDCTVSKNYFTALERELLYRKDRNGCSVYFEHPLKGNEYPTKIYDAIYFYELHLRYYLQALRFTGFPNVFHTVGSSLAVKCKTYIRVGGMNRKQAGEDFYFVQKVVPGGGYFSLNSATVFPSPRASHRVPFGTGTIVGKMIFRNEEELFTYDPFSFVGLKSFFEKTDDLFKSGNDEMKNLSVDFPECIKLFLEENDWINKICEINSNTSGLLSFRKRFYDWFNMFRIVKYLNFAHKSSFIKMPVTKAAEIMLGLMEHDIAEARRVGLLEYYRDLEKQI